MVHAHQLKEALWRKPPSRSQPMLSALTQGCSKDAFYQMIKVAKTHGSSGDISVPVPSQRCGTCLLRALSHAQSQLRLNKGRNVPQEPKSFLGHNVALFRKKRENSFVPFFLVSFTGNQIQELKNGRLMCSKVLFKAFACFPAPST